MDAAELLRSISEAVEEMQGRDIVRLDIRHLSDVSDYFLIADGRSERQVRAMARKVRETLAERGVRPVGVEGEKDADWILLDFGAVVVHLMSTAAREFYALERLWAPEDQPGKHPASGRAF